MGHFLAVEGGLFLEVAERVEAAEHSRMDKYHAKGHSMQMRTLACVPEGPSGARASEERQRYLSASGCEQTFARFRGYSPYFKTTQNQRITDLSLARKHNLPMRQGGSRHLTAFSANKQQARKAEAQPRWPI